MAGRRDRASLLGFVKWWFASYRSRRHKANSQELWTRADYARSIVEAHLAARRPAAGRRTILGTPRHRRRIPTRLALQEQLAEERRRRKRKRRRQIARESRRRNRAS